MARGFNKVIIVGNLARDPEIRYTVDKRAWARFTVAVSFSWKDKNGEYKDGADFIPVVVWGPRAEFCSRYLKKGSSVLVEGKIKVRSYEAKDGSGKRYSTDVEASDVQFVGSKRGSDEASSDGGGSGGYEIGAPDSAGFGGDANFGKSVREKGFGDSDFPMDFSEMGDSGGETDAEIPF